MTEDERYTVKVDGGSTNFQIGVSREVAEQIIVFAVTGGYTTQATSTKSKASSQEQLPLAVTEHDELVQEQQEEEDVRDSNGRPRKSIREFFNDVQPSRNPDRIAAIGRYLEKFLKEDSFTRDDLRKWFMHARAPVPKNLTRDINWTIKNGWIAEDPTVEGTYYLTDVGINVVDSKFPEEAVEKTRLTTKRRRPTSNGEDNGSS